MGPGGGLLSDDHTKHGISVTKCRNMLNFSLFKPWHSKNDHHDHVRSEIFYLKVSFIITKKIFLGEIAQVYFSRYYFVCERREIFSRLNLCLAERERDWPWAKQTRSDCIHYLWRLYRCTCPLYTLYTCTLSLSPQLVHWPGAGTRTLPGMTSHCNQGQTSLKYFLQSNPHKYLVHNQRLLLGWWSMVLTC